MALKGKPIAVSATHGNTATDIYTAPTSTESAVHTLYFSNTTASAITLTLKVFNSADNSTVTLLDTYSIAGDAEYTFPKVLTLAGADKIQATASASSGLVAYYSVSESTASVSLGFSPRGIWSSSSNYVKNDIVSASNGNSYVASQASSNQDPTTATAYWTLLSSKGDQGDVSLTGTQTLTNKTLTSPVLGGTTTTASGNLVVNPATQIVEVYGGGSTEGAIKLNCSANSHGQTVKAQPHSENITNTLLLPKGSNSTLVSEVADQELSSKKMGALLREKATVDTNATTGTINFDVKTQNVQLRTTNASANFILNIRGDASTTLNSSMATGESISIAFEAKQGSTAYYMTAIQIDGSTVSPVYWQGGTAPDAGTADGIDSYLINITKTGASAYTVLASLTAFTSVT